MFSQRIRNVMDHEAMLTIRPQGSVREAAGLIANSKASSVLVVEGDELTGIFTSSDAVRRVLAKGLDPDTTPLSEVMSSPVRTVHPDWTFGRALQLMHEFSLRVLPVVEDGKPIGILCARDALDPELEEFTCEAQRRESFTPHSNVKPFPLPRK